MDTAAEASVMSKTAKGAGWMISWRFATRALGLLSTLALVRLLLPSDFGLVALGAAFAQSVDSLSVLGVEDVVVRAEAPDRATYDTAFTINAIRGVATAALIALASYPAAAFFSEPRLFYVLLALAAAALIDGFENIGIVDFRRHFTFDKEFRLQIIPRVIGIVLAVGCAAIFHSYLALVVGIISTRCLRTVLGYTMHPYRPRLSLSAWHAIVGFSFWTWLVSLVSLLRDRGPNFIVARMTNPTQLGIFTVAVEVAGLPTSELIEPLCRVCFSGFAADRTDVASSYLRVVAVAAAITLPLGVGLSSVADPLVRTAFGPQWLEAIWPTQLLAAAGTVTVIGYVSATLFNAHAHLSLLFRLTVATVVLRLGLLLLLSAAYGLPGAAAALALATVFDQVVYFRATAARFPVTLAALCARCWRPVLATAAMSLVIAAAGLGWSSVDGTPSAQMLQAVLTSALGAAVYLSTATVAWLACGRPEGAETDLLRVFARFVPRLRRDGPAAPATPV